MSSSKQKRLKVFISSTSKDLKDHRDVLIPKLEESDYDLIVMEEFGARNADAIDVSLKEVQPCDIFVGIYAKRYGYIPDDPRNPNRISVTEMEYHEAVRLNKPRIVFRFEEHEEKPTPSRINEHSDLDDSHNKKQMKAFIDMVGSSRVWKTFTTPQDLVDIAIPALARQRWFIPDIETQIRQTDYVTRPDTIVRHQLLQTMYEEILRHKKIALIGAGGIGKTFLAEIFAVKYRQFFSGGVLFVSLSPDDNDPDQLSQRLKFQWIQYFREDDVIPSEKDMTYLEFRQRLSMIDSPLLVVLDNVWDGSAASGLVKNLLPSDTFILVTARRNDIPTLMNIKRHLEIDRFQLDESLSFMRDRLGPSPVTSQLTSLHNSFGGLPLALELAVNTMKRNLETNRDYVEQFIEEIEGRSSSNTLFDSLNIETREQSLEAVLSLSYDQLTSDLQTRFRALGALPIELTLNARMIASVSGDAQGAEGEPIALQDAKDRADALVAYGLLAQQEDLYLQHRTYWTYAHALFIQNEGQNVLEAREWDYEVHICDATSDIFDLVDEARVEEDAYIPHIDYVGTLRANRLRLHLQDIGYSDYEKYYSPQIEQAQREHITTELSDLRNVLAPVTYFSTSVYEYIDDRPQVGLRGKQWLEMGLLASRAMNDLDLEARHLQYLADWYLDRNENRVAETYLRALENFDNKLKVSRFKLPRVQFMQAKLFEALGNSEKSRQIYKNLYKSNFEHATSVSWRALTNLYDLDILEHDISSAKQHLETLKHSSKHYIKKSPELKEHIEIDLVFRQIRLHVDQGQYEVANETIQALANQHPFIFEIEHYSLIMGNIQWRLGRYSEALIHYTRVENFARSSLDTGTLVTVLIQKAQIMFEQGDFSQLAIINKELKITIHDGLSTWHKLLLYNVQAITEFGQGEYHHAVQHLKEALDLIDSSKVRYIQPWILLNMAVILITSGQIELGRMILDRLKYLPNSDENSGVKIKYYKAELDYCIYTQNTELGDKVAKAAIQYIIQQGSNQELPNILNSYCVILSRLNRLEEATTNLKKAKFIAEKFGLKREYIHSTIMLAQVYIQTNDLNQVDSSLHDIQINKIDDRLLRSLYLETYLKFAINTNQISLVQHLLYTHVHHAKDLSPAQHAARLGMAARFASEIKDYESAVNYVNQAIRIMTNHNIYYLDTNASLFDLVGVRLIYEAQRMGYLQATIRAMLQLPFLVLNLIYMLILFTYGSLSQSTIGRLEKLFRRDNSMKFVNASESFLAIVLNLPRLIIFPRHHVPLLETAVSLIQIGHNQLAFRLINRAITIPESFTIVPSFIGGTINKPRNRFTFQSMLASAYQLRGTIHYENGNYIVASRDFQTSLEYFGGKSLLHYYIGRIALWQEDYELAYKYLSRANSLDHTISLYWIGNAQVGLGNLIDAINTFSDLINKDPDDVVSYYWRALVRIQQDVFDESIEVDLNVFATDQTWNDQFFESYWCYVVYDCRGDDTQRDEIKVKLETLSQSDKIGWLGLNLLRLVQLKHSEFDISEDATLSQLEKLRYYSQILRTLYPLNKDIDLLMKKINARIEYIFVNPPPI